MQKPATQPYWSVDPEIAGQIGPGSQLDTSVHPPKVDYLVYAVDNWSGDDIVQTFPCMLVTPRLAKALESAGLSGARATNIGVRVAYDSDSRIPKGMKPDFWRLNVTGSVGRDDFGLTTDSRLVVSGRALEFLQGFSCTGSVIEPFKISPSA
jgi:hypothetical protein